MPSEQGLLKGEVKVGNSSDVRPYPDLHEHLQSLDRAGLLITVNRRINKDTEMHPLVRWQFRGGIEEKDRKAFLFTNVTDIAALPFWVGVFCTLGGGWLGDYLIQRGVSPTVSRKSIIGIGLTAATIMVIAAVFTQQSWLAVTLLTLCVACLRTTTGSVNSLPIDLAPPSAVGSLTAIQNLFGNLAGMLAPITAGYLVNSTGSFVDSFIVAGAMALFGAISYVFIIGNLERQQIEPRTPMTVSVSPSRAV